MLALLSLFFASAFAANNGRAMTSPMRWRDRDQYQRNINQEKMTVIFAVLADRGRNVHHGGDGKVRRLVPCGKLHKLDGFAR